MRCQEKMRDLILQLSKRFDLFQQSRRRVNFFDKVTDVSCTVFR